MATTGIYGNPIAVAHCTGLAGFDGGFQPGQDVGPGGGDGSVDLDIGNRERSDQVLGGNGQGARRGVKDHFAAANVGINLDCSFQSRQDSRPGGVAADPVA